MKPVYLEFSQNGERVRINLNKVLVIVQAEVGEDGRVPVLFHFAGGSTQLVNLTGIELDHVNGVLREMDADA